MDACLRGCSHWAPVACVDFCWLCSEEEGLENMDPQSLLLQLLAFLFDPLQLCAASSQETATLLCARLLSPAAHIACESGSNAQILVLSILKYL